MPTTGLQDFREPEIPGEETIWSGLHSKQGSHDAGLGCNTPRRMKIISQEEGLDVWEYGD
jgi:hypothetical protein